MLNNRIPKHINCRRTGRGNNLDSTGFRYAITRCVHNSVANFKVTLRGSINRTPNGCIVLKAIFIIEVVLESIDFAIREDSIVNENFRNQATCSFTSSLPTTELKLANITSTIRNKSEVHTITPELTAPTTGSADIEVRLGVSRLPEILSGYPTCGMKAVYMVIVITKNPVMSSRGNKSKIVIAIVTCD